MLESDLTSLFVTRANIPGMVVAIAPRRGPSGEHFNLSFATETYPGEVVANRSTFCQSLNIDSEQIVVPRQVHESNVACVTRVDRGRGALTWDSAIPATDAMVTRETDLYMLQIYADCTPILFADPSTRSVGIAHAGWRSTAASIAQVTVRRMSERFGTRPADVIALIGPAIGGCCYEVSEEVARSIAESAGDNRMMHMGPRGLPHVDLAEANRLQLLIAGLEPENVLMSGICTSCNVDRYFSHRAEAGRAGRFAAIIGIHSNGEQETSQP